MHDIDANAAVTFVPDGEDEQAAIEQQEAKLEQAIEQDEAAQDD